jgi:hypothetical protein
VGSQQASGGLIDRIYPVPASDRLLVKAVSAGDIDLQILNVSGRVVYTGRYQVHPEAEIEIDLKDFGPGMYFVRVSNGESVDSRKLIIRK